MMTAKQQQYKKALITKIQIHKSKRFRNDEDRREYMMNRFGVSSTTKLNIEQLNMMLDFILKGEDKQSLASDRQKAYIVSLWKSKSRTKSDIALLGFVAKTIKRSLLSLDELEYKEVGMVVAGINKL
jgi:hypothetical protein